MAKTNNLSSPTSVSRTKLIGSYDALDPRYGAFCWELTVNVATCEVPRTRTVLGDRSFAVAGLCLWNNLPLHLRDAQLTVLEFRWLLKMDLSAEDHVAY